MSQMDDGLNAAQNNSEQDSNLRQTIVNVILILIALALLVLNLAVSLALLSQPSGNLGFDVGFLCGRVLFLPLLVVGLAALWERTRTLTYLLTAFVLASSCSFCLSLALLGNQLAAVG